MKNLSMKIKKMNSEKYILITGGLIITTIILTVTLLTNIYDLGLIIPRSVDKDYFTTFAINKISDTKDLEFVLSKYKLNSSGKKYELQQIKNEEELHRLRQILDQAGYYARLRAREIETPLKLLFNGYLGQFFRFSQIGVVAWLAIPSTIYLLTTVNRRHNWEKALLTTYITALIIISIKGYDNFRYQLTLLPVSLAIVFYTSFEVLEKTKHRKVIERFFIIILTLTILYDFSAVEKYSSLISQEFKITYHMGTNFKFLSLSPSGKKDLPVDIANTVEYIESLNIPHDRCILVNNTLFPYYYTQGSYVYYWNHKDVYLSRNGFLNLMEGKSYEEISRFITHILKCSHILTRYSFEEYNPIFSKYLIAQTNKVFESGDYLIYKIRSK